MDQTLKLKLKDFKTALGHLQSALAQPLDDEDFMRDAAIQRFEYSFEIAFKVTKLYLSNQLGVDERSPKGCFRALISTNVFSAEDIEQLLQMVDDRNKTVHTYSEELVQKLYKKLNSYAELMQKIYNLAQQ